MVYYQEMNAYGSIGWASCMRRQAAKRGLGPCRLFLVLFIGIMHAAPASGQVSVLTAQYDNGRSSANLNETVLNTSNVNVNQFGMLFSRSLDGYLYAQPLYVPKVSIPGQGTHNVIYLATSHNTVVAFDADDPSQAAPLWQVNLGLSWPAQGAWGGFLLPEMGIISTPVIDPATSTLYVEAATIENGSYFQRLHALDITTGQEKFGGPVAIQATVPGTGYDNQNGVEVFDSGNQLQRAGLLLANGAVYIAFASIGDGDYWHGWVMAYNASDIQQQVFAYNATVDGGRGGIWQSGMGLDSDASGNLYFMTGNGDYDGANNFGDSIVKLSAGGTVLDWFTPDDQSMLASSDEDLGSSGPILIPNTDLLVGGGKQGILYLVNSSGMGHFLTGNGQIVGNFQATLGEIHHPAVWNLSGGPLLYLWGSDDVLKAFQFGNGTLNSTPVAENATTAEFPGGILAISANGSTSGSGILWAETPSSDSSSSVVTGTLRAYNATDVSRELWDSDQNATRDALGNFAKFTTPTIANGKVYAATFSNQLDVYGLLGSSSAPVSIWMGPGSVALTADGQQQQFSATVAGTSNVAVAWRMSPSLGTLTQNGLYTAPDPSSISSTQTVTITATSQADTTKSASATVTLTPIATTGTAIFSGIDNTTEGNWQGAYGADGYNVINNAVSYPSYVTVTPSGNNATTWTALTTDVRALLMAGSTTNRIAATWFSDSSFIINLAFNDTVQHQLAIYCLDWDTTIRSERIDILDTNGVLLDTRNVSSFHNGEYLVWQLSGNVQVRVTNLNPDDNAVISGLFFATKSEASLTSPTPNTELAGPSATFSWAAVAGSTDYTLWLGTTQGTDNLYVSGPITATSATVSNLPTNGETIYARLYTIYGSSSVYTDYVFTAATQAALTSPTPGTVLAGPKVTFSWSAAPGATAYKLWIGTTAGSDNLYTSGPIMATSGTPTNLPTNGETIYVTLVTVYGSIQVHANYVYTAATQAALTSPTPSTVLAGPSVTFTWSASPGATGYRLWIGTTAGTENLYNSGLITANSATPSNLPTNGETIYVTLVTVYGSSQVYIDYTFTAATEAALTSPTPGTVLAGPKVTFNWSAPPGATGYKLWIGSAAGKNNLYSSGAITTTTATPTNLPVNGEAIYVTLVTVYGTSQVSNAYSFTAATQAALTSPTPSTVLAGPSVPFTWSASAQATGYKLLIGTTAGSGNMYNSGTTTSTTATPGSLPTNGETLFVTLETLYGAGQASTAYTFTAATKAALTSPTPGSTLAGAQVTFNWTAAPGSTAYKLWIGSAAGKNDLYSSGAITLTTATPTKLPTNGETVYVTLVTVYGPIQINANYVYTAATQAALTSPTPSTVLAGPSVTFTWSASPGASGYRLWIGTSAGTENLYSSGLTTTTSATPTYLPRRPRRP